MPYVYDGKDTRYEESNVPLKDQHTYYDNNKPKLISGLNSTLITNSNFEYGGHGEIINRGHEVSCDCSKPTISVSANLLEDESSSYWVSPVKAHCTHCNKLLFVFDEREHGYDGEHKNNDWMEPPSGEFRKLYDFQSAESLIVAFHYTDEGFEFDDEIFIRDGETGGPRPEDCFTWFSIFLRKGNGELVQLFDAECA